MGERKRPILTNTRNNQTGSLSVHSHVFLLSKFQFRSLLEPRSLQPANEYIATYHYILFVRPFLSRKRPKFVTNLFTWMNMMAINM